MFLCRKKLFEFFVSYRSSWVKRGYDTPIVNALIFRKMRDIVGGQLRMLLSGGAPLSEDAHDFIRYWKLGRDAVASASFLSGHTRL